MFYNTILTPALIKIAPNILLNLDRYLKENHLIFNHKTLITQENLYSNYKNILEACGFTRTIFCKGGSIDETSELIDKIKNEDSLIVAFGGGSILDLVKFCATQVNKPYVTAPSTLSNDAIFSCVARLTQNKKKKSFGVQPPIGVIVDLDIVRDSPTHLILAGVADLVSNLSALQDWVIAHKLINEPINELAYMLARQAAIPIFNYNSADLKEDNFLTDLSNGLICSGLSMMISGDTRGTSGAEHLISHAIDEYFTEKSTVHGIQVGWAHLIIEKLYRHNSQEYKKLSSFFESIGLMTAFENMINWEEDDIKYLIPYARTIRNRFTIFNTI